MHSHDRTLLSRLGFADPDKKDSRHDLACQYLALPENHERLARVICERRLPRYKRRIERLMSADEWLTWARRPEVTGVRADLWVEFERIGKPVLEKPLSKGEGQFKTVIGFLDLWLPYILKVCESGEARGPFVPNPAPKPPSADRFSIRPGTRLPETTETASDPWCEYLPGEWRPHNALRSVRALAVAEIKIQPVGVGEVLRQIKLYREFLSLEAASVSYIEVGGVPGPRHDWELNWVVATVFPMSPADIASLAADGIRHVRLGPKFDEWAKARANEPPPADGSPEF